MKPQRIQLRRARGFNLQAISFAANGLAAVKVDRTTIWGNPYVVGTHGTTVHCVYLFTLLTAGLFSLGHDFPAQDRFFKAFRREAQNGYPSLRARNLACWCRVGTPCHGDVLLQAANQPRRARAKIDIDEFFARYGWRIDNGKAERIKSGAAV